jgi:hypothetical protein
VELSARIQKDMVQAAKDKDKVRLSALRMIRSVLQNREIEKRAPLTDDEVVQALSSIAKRHKESIEQFGASGRDDLVQKETAELEVVATFLPEQMDEQAIEALIKSIIEELGAKSPKDIGAVMKTAMPQLTGKADGKLVQRIARELLSA